MRIEQVHLRKVGPFEDVRIIFPPGSDPAMADVYLLTGPNGSGKSTVLYAIAAAVGGGRGDLGENFALRRMREAESVAAVIGDGERRAVAWHQFRLGPIQRIDDPFGGPSLSLTDLFTGHFGASDGKVDYGTAAGNFEMMAPPAVRPSFGWAAFAYAGARSVEDVQVTSVEEPQHSPFKNSLSFRDTADSKQLANWIANQKYKQLKAKDAGRVERAEQFARSIRDIERVIGEIIEDETFAFVTTDEDNNVRVRRDGIVVDLGVLPDGLKSIVSWIADLLMRLDRIPWVDETPPMQRPFLLLLDEIDIHLHPSWQRKVLPIVQRMFPNAQIIASTHSPFVVASASDAHIIALGVKDGVATVESTAASQVGHSYSAVLRSIFGIDTEFDVDTERMFQSFHEAKGQLLAGDATARARVDQLGDALAHRSEEVRELIGFELRQLSRQLAQRSAQ